MESRYNIRFALKTAESPNKTLEADVKSGNTDYDILLDERQSLKNSITSGYLQDWHTTSVDLAASWWDANCASGYDINSKLYQINSLLDKLDE